MSTASINDALNLFEIPAPITDLESFREWAYSKHFPDQGKVTFFAGRILFDMSPERIDLHTAIKTEITRVLASLVKEYDWGHLYADGVRVSHKQAKISNEPDASFASWETLESGKLAPPGGKGDRFIDLIGTPDWVCEILSDSSIEKDTKVLREAYFKAGIPEYWLIDARGEEIDFKLLVAGNDGYEETPSDGDGWRRSQVFGREFHLSRERDRVNRWRYTLAHRPG